MGGGAAKALPSSAVLCVHSQSGLSSKSLDLEGTSCRWKVQGFLRGRGAQWFQTGPGADRSGSRPSLPLGTGVTLSKLFNTLCLSFSI